MADSIPAAMFGSTGRQVSRCGLGGEGVLRTFGREAEAAAVLDEAARQGVTYYDCARAYAGSEVYQGRRLRGSPGLRDRIFQCSKSAERTASGALQELETTLSNLGTDHLDLWQIHDVRTEDDIRAIEAPGGALAGFLQAKKQGLARHIGVTGHHDPAVLTYCVSAWPVDSVLLPVNPAEAALGGFLDETLPAARQRGLAVIGMKILGAGNYLFPESGVTAELLIRFALAQDIDVAIVGCSTPEHVRVHAEAGRDAEPLPEETRRALIEAFRPQARRLAYYRGGA